MARTAAFLLAVALLGTAVHASYDEPSFGDCTKADDCTGGEDGDATTICSVYDSVTVAATTDPVAPSKTFHFGKCVQCVSSCDCNADEWCAPAFSVTSNWWGAAASRMSDAQKEQKAGLLASWTNGDYKFAGKCVKYGADDAEAEKIGSTCSNNLQSVSALTKKAEHSNQNAFCAWATNWQAATLPCTGTGCPSPATDNPTADKPGYCTATVMASTGVAQTSGQCTSSWSTSNGVAQSQQGIGWAGHCDQNNACQICQTGSYACTSNSAQARVCIGGTWAPVIAIPDLTARSVNVFAIAQIYVSLMVFMVVLMLAMCVNCIFTVRMASKAGDAAEKTADNPAYSA